MTRRTYLAVIAGSLVLAVAGASLARRGGTEAPIAGVDPIIDGRIMVRLRPTLPLSSFIAQFNADHVELGIVLTELDTIPGRPIHLLEFDHTLLDHAQLEALEIEIQTEYFGTFLAWGEFLYGAETAEGKTGSFWLSIQPDQGIYDGQFAFDLLNLPAAHIRSTGAGTVVALLDTGVDATHPLLQSRVLATGVDFIDDDGDPDDAGNGLDDDQDGEFDEMTGHGTFIAGLIRATAPDASILPVRVLNSDGVSDNWIITKGLYFAIDRGVEVINASLGSTYKSEGVEDASERAKSLGIVVVGAAGNFNRSDPEEFPAVLNSSFGVVATDHTDVKTAESNFGVDVTLTAPGSRLLIGEIPPEYDPAFSVVSALPGGGLGVWSGTSMAAGFVSGAAALVRAQHPEWPTDLMLLEDVYEGVLDTLVNSAMNIDAQNPGLLGMLGSGRLDVGAAALAGPVAPPLGDLDGDKTVGVVDLLTLLGRWGKVHDPADLDGSGLVGVGDLLILLGNWQ